VLARLALLVVSTLVALLLLEAAMRLEIVPLPDFVQSDGWWEERWARERKGLNPREFVQLDSELGYIPAANLRDFEYEGARFSTNSAHARGRREIPKDRGSGPRVVVIGDSFSFGQCANDDETYPAVMRERLPDTEVLNLGVMGYGQDQALLRLRRDGFPFGPDVVVFGFHPNNVRRNLLRFRGYAKPRFVLEEEGLVLDNVPVPPPEEFVGFWPPRFWNLVRIFRDSRIDPKEQRWHMRKLSVAIVHQMAVDTQAAGARLVVVHLPHPGSLKGEGEQGWGFMDSLCSKESPAPFLCVSPVPRFREIAHTPELVKQHFDCHFSPELYRALGEVLSEALLREFPELFPIPRPEAQAP